MESSPLTILFYYAGHRDRDSSAVPDAAGGTFLQYGLPHAGGNASERHRGRSGKHRHQGYGRGRYWANDLYLAGGLGQLPHVGCHRVSRAEHVPRLGSANECDGELGTELETRHYIGP